MPNPILPPEHLALIDQEAAHFSERLDQLIHVTRALDADNGGVPTIAQLTTVLLNEISADKVAAIAASAILRLARHPDRRRST